MQSYFEDNRHVYCMIKTKWSKYLFGMWKSSTAILWIGILGTPDIQLSNDKIVLLSDFKTVWGHNSLHFPGCCWTLYSDKTFLSQVDTAKCKISKLSNPHMEIFFRFCYELILLKYVFYFCHLFKMVTVIISEGLGPGKSNNFEPTSNKHCYTFCPSMI